MATIEEARKLKGLLKKLYEDDDNVNFGIGGNRGVGYSIAVSLTEPDDSLDLPATLKGIPIHVETIGRATARATLADALGVKEQLDERYADSRTVFDIHITRNVASGAYGVRLSLWTALHDQQEKIEEEIDGVRITSMIVGTFLVDGDPRIAELEQNPIVPD